MRRAFILGIVLLALVISVVAFFDAMPTTTRSGTRTASTAAPSTTPEAAQRKFRRPDFEVLGQDGAGITYAVDKANLTIDLKGGTVEFFALAHVNKANFQITLFVVNCGRPRTFIDVITIGMRNGEKFTQPSTTASAQKITQDTPLDKAAAVACTIAFGQSA